jgi:mRNA interferase RelE/StbE
MWKGEALEDIKQLDQGQRVQVVKAINKVVVNPLPQNEGGYGKPLGKKGSTNLTGYSKIKLLKLGLRVVYSSGAGK